MDRIHNRLAIIRSRIGLLGTYRLCPFNADNTAPVAVGFYSIRSRLFLSVVRRLIRKFKIFSMEDAAALLPLLFNPIEILVLHGRNQVERDAGDDFHNRIPSSGFIETPEPKETEAL